MYIPILSCFKSITFQEQLDSVLWLSLCKKISVGQVPPNLADKKSWFQF